MSDSIGAGVSRSDLNSDIAVVTEQLGKVNYQQTLSRYFPARNITPRDYANNHLTKRRVKCIYVGPSGTVPLVCPAGWDLLVVMGVGFTRRETEDVTELLQNAKTGERVILAVPLQAMSGATQLKELFALETLSQNDPYDKEGPSQDLLNSRRDLLRRQVVDRLRKCLAPNFFRWIYQGEVVEEAPAGSRNVFFSGFLQTIFNKSPRLASQGSKRDQIEAVNEVLDLANPLQLSTVSKKGGAYVLQKMLGANGILEIDNDCGSYVRYKVAGPLEESNLLAPVWNHLLERLVGDGKHNVTLLLSDIVKEFTRMPYGISQSFLAILLGVAFRRYYPDLDLSRDGESQPLSGITLRSALASPKGLEIKFHPFSEDECAFLTSTVDLFAGPDAKINTFVNLWESAKEAVFAWYNSLPALTHAFISLPEKNSRELVKFLEDKEKTESARDMFSLYLPSLMGETGIPLANHQEQMINWLKQAKEGLDSYPKYRQDILVVEIGKLFTQDVPGEDQDTSQWLDSKFKCWFDRLYPNTREQNLTALAKALVELYDSQEDFATKWFDTLPKSLGLEPLCQWSPDCTPMFISRITRARLELELWRVRVLHPLPEDKAKCTEVIRQWMREMMDGMQLEQSQRESVILDLLELYCWAN